MPDDSVSFLYNRMHMETAPQHILFLCIKTVLVLFLLDLACVLFRPVPFEINRAIMRLAGRQSFIKKRTAKENAIKERVAARELRVPNWCTVMANNKYRADNLAAIANLITNKDQVSFDDDNNKLGAAPSKLISNQPLPFSLAYRATVLWRCRGKRQQDPAERQRYKNLA
jgi:hypothetical protein